MLKVSVVLCLVAAVGLSTAAPQTIPTDCAFNFAENKCDHTCEEGTHVYTLPDYGCGYLLREATCENPHPVFETDARLCDYSECHCDAPTVRDRVTNKCVPLDECPAKGA